MTRTVSGAPSWAIAFGLGTPEESAARPQSTKWAVRVLWTAILTGLFVAYAMLFDRGTVSTSSVALMVLVSALTVLAWVVGTHFALRRR